MLAAAPAATTVPRELDINKRGHPKWKRNSGQNIFRWKEKKIQGNLSPVKRADVKGARSKVKNASKPNSLPGEKVVSEKEMRLTIKALLLQNFLNAKMKEWGKIAIEVASTLNMDIRMVMHVIKDATNDQ